jgi:hypothetical protein
VRASCALLRGTERRAAADAVGIIYGVASGSALLVVIAGSRDVFVAWLIVTAIYLSVCALVGMSTYAKVRRGVRWLGGWHAVRIGAKMSWRGARWVIVPTVLVVTMLIFAAWWGI